MTDEDWKETQDLSATYYERVHGYVRAGSTHFQMSSEPPPELCERYSVRRVLGQGGSGVVFLAEDTKIGRLVAIKRLPSGGGEDKGVYERFLQEAKIAGQLEHPNVVIVYNVEGTKESDCIVMEYLGGGSLRDFLYQREYMAYKCALPVMLGILSGLEATHHQTVIHRDIKPENILFGMGGTSKITDFGIAQLPRHREATSGSEKEGQTRILCGTPEYMSPEQLNRGYVDHRTDLYSAGVVFYEMITGRLPYAFGASESLDGIRSTVAHVEPQKIRTYRGDVPEALEDFIYRLLAKYPEDRYPNAKSAMQALLAIAPHLPESESSCLDDSALIPPAYGLNSATAIFKDIISLLLIDGEITKAEREELNKRAEKFGISENQAKLIEEKVRQEKGLTKDRR